MWEQLELNWRLAFTLAWKSFCTGNVPVGCVIVNEKNEVVAQERNLIFAEDNSSPLAGTRMAHAELLALTKLKKDDHPKIVDYTLYTTLEPCPMCFGAMVMMHIRKVKYAARDGIAGSICLKSATPYLKSKNLQVELADPVLEAFQVALVIAFELERGYPRLEEFLDLYSIHSPEGVRVGTELSKQGYFEKAKEENYTCKQVFCHIREHLELS